ncbi:glycosyltransferase family 4 protein [Hyunsoonleella sp. SJ7]|uniref:Glycosyltransferase family 4 protein n=1 Tax=Hyunsoonleella aquatilis TaxID=2762758 RepID=A0A923KG84_9FLAO|nr:glycosyltransferase family 4 protein [Hyunsoonleella aquatilis]MBC3757776.1 glycosyltransferase family 4 protein [Hyunsoonleella aquatilis]
MRVLQLIDSLKTGGAERVAVNLANVLATHIDVSFLCATRKEGLLKSGLSQNVQYVFLDKRRTLDIQAIRTLFKFVKINQIDIIHAHSTSFFLATLVKLLLPKVKIIWHDHYGNSEFVNKRKSGVLRYCSKYFSHVIAVNETLKQWGIKNLKIDNVDFLSNFSIQDTIEPQTSLAGTMGKRVIHLANFRPQKNHELLFKSFSSVIKKHPDWTLHCVGEDFKDDYSKKNKAIIKDNNLSSNVFIYGSKPDVANILSQSTIGVLSSDSEGLPLAVLEYGMAGLPVVATDVGDCNLIVSNEKEGLLVEPNDLESFSNSLLKLVENPDLREKLGENIKNKVFENFSEEKVVEHLLNIYQSTLI